MKRTDIPEEHFKNACKHVNTAMRELRDSGEGRWDDEDYRSFIDESLFFGMYWRRIMKIDSVESAKRELLYLDGHIGSKSW